MLLHSFLWNTMTDNKYTKPAYDIILIYKKYKKI